MRAMNRLSVKSVTALSTGKCNDEAGLWLVKTTIETGEWVLRFTAHGRWREDGARRYQYRIFKGSTVGC